MYKSLSDSSEHTDLTAEDCRSGASKSKGNIPELQENKVNTPSST